MAPVAQPAQEPIQIDLDGAGPFHHQGIIIKRLSQSLADIRSPSAHSPQIDPQTRLTTGTLQQIVQFRFCSRGQLQVAITSA